MITGICRPTVMLSFLHENSCVGHLIQFWKTSKYVFVSFEEHHNNRNNEMLETKDIPADVSMRDLSSPAFFIYLFKTLWTTRIVVRNLNPKKILVNGNTEGDIHQKWKHEHNEGFVVDEALIPMSLVYKT